MKKPILLFLLVLVFGFAKAQPQTIDSLTGKLPKADDTTQVTILLGIADIYSATGKYDSALSSYFNALNIAEKTSDKTYIIRSLSGIADLYALQNKVEEALKFAFRALKLAEEQKNKRNIYGIQSQIGLIYFNSRQYNESLKYGLKNLNAVAGSTDKEMLIDAYLRMGDIYKGLMKYDSALYFEAKALKEIKALGNKRYLAMCLNNTGTIYQAQQKNAEALNYFLQAFATIENIGSAQEIAMYAANISGAFINIKDLTQALFYAKKSLAISQTTGNKEWQKEMLKQIAVIYAYQKDFKEAFEYMNKYDELKDSLNASENQDNILDLQSHYENEQKEKQIEFLKKEAALNTTLRNILIGSSVLLLIIVLLITRQYRLKRNSEASINLKNIALSKTLEELKSTQAQLIQSEKMASLGELTAGIAHEIQNPLNFVNNFSEVNKELIQELKSEKSKVKSERDDQLETEILNDIYINEEKINHHGKRADAIVKGMLQHSRKSTGQKEATDLNALTDEYLRLSYHGMRAKDKNFNADFNADFDESLSADAAENGKINIVPQDIGRVLLNLFNNAFYAVNVKKKSADESYKPTVTVKTKKLNNNVEITVSDNGNGIPQNIVDKIFQPFFTTKPTGEGTGLGLSLAYDIITKEHNGTIKVENLDTGKQEKENGGSKFTITLPAY